MKKEGFMKTEVKHEGWGGGSTVCRGLGGETVQAPLWGPSFRAFPCLNCLYASGIGISIRHLPCDPQNGWRGEEK